MDGTLTTSFALAVAWALEILPTAEPVTAANGLGVAAGLARTPQMTMLAAHVGATLAVRALVVFCYYTASVALGGQTVARRLRAFAS